MLSGEKSIQRRLSPGIICLYVERQLWAITSGCSALDLVLRVTTELLGGSASRSVSMRQHGSLLRKGLKRKEGRPL